MKLNLIFPSDIKLLTKDFKFLIKRHNVPNKPSREIYAIKFVVYPSNYSLQIIVLSRCKNFTKSFDIPSHSIEHSYLELPDKNLIEINLLFYTTFLYL